MEIQLNMWDAIKLQLMRNPEQTYKLTSHQHTVRLDEFHESTGMFLAAFQHNEVLKSLANDEHAYVVYKEGELKLYVKWFTVFLGKVEYLGTNQYGGPRLRIDGKVCNTMKSISKAVFGEVKPVDYVREFITPYYMEEKTNRYEEAMAEIKLEDFELIEVKQVMGNYFPVIAYRGDTYSGVTKLRGALPQLQNEQLAAEIFEYIGWRPQQYKPRHIALIERFRIVQIGDNLFELNENLYIDSKQKVQDYIRQQPEGSIGRGTAKKMFDELERRRQE